MEYTATGKVKDTRSSELVSLLYYFNPNNVSIQESSITRSVGGILACSSSESTWSLMVTSTSLLTSIPLSSKNKNGFSSSLVPIP